MSAKRQRAVKHSLMISALLAYFTAHQDRSTSADTSRELAERILDMKRSSYPTDGWHSLKLATKDALIVPSAKLARST